VRRGFHNLSAAFSLLETTIGVAILGLGLIMVAAIYPVALTQHRQSLDQSRALELVPQAAATVHNRIRQDLLWNDATTLAQGLDSPFYVLPMVNIDVTGLWSMDAANPNNVAFIAPYDYMLYQTDLLNQNPLIVPIGPIAPSIQQVPAADFLTDRTLARDDRQANEAASRMIWYGFYRHLATGSKTYAAAICKQRREQQFYMQSIDPTLAENVRYADPQALVDRPQRFPVPWRVTVQRLPGSQTLFMNATAVHLADLAPRGSKFMIHGASYTVDPRGYAVPAGRVLTVIDPVQATATAMGVEVLESIADIPDASQGAFGFDVWVIPPSSYGSLYDDGLAGGGADYLSFEKDSPVLEWKVSL